MAYFTITQAHVGNGYAGKLGSPLRKESVMAKPLLGRIQQGDIGKRVYYGAGFSRPYVENLPQYLDRIARESRNADS